MGSSLVLMESFVCCVSRREVNKMEISINLCGICGGSTLGGILGGLAKLIPVISGGGE